MSFSMSKASPPRFSEISLNALSVILDKAEAHAAAKKIDPSVLLHSRLSPDMFALVRQVQIATDAGQERLGATRRRRLKRPPTKIMRRRWMRTKGIAHRKNGRLSEDARPEADRRVGRSGDRVPARPDQHGPHERNDDYLNHFVLPGVYFHLTTAPMRSCAIAAWTSANATSWAQSPCR